MLPADVLAALVCPQTKQPLLVAEQSLINEMNKKIASRAILNLEGITVSEPLEGGFLRQDKTILYPIRNGIPLLLQGEGIKIDQP